METEIYLGIIAIHTDYDFKIETAVAMTEVELINKMVMLVSETCGLPMPALSEHEDIEDRRASLNALVLSFNRIDSHDRASVQMVVVSVVDAEIASFELMGASP